MNSIANTQLLPVEDRTLRAQVTQQILARVTGGHYLPGEKLTETALAEQLQISRAPLREAMRELVDRGILISQPYKGFHVRPVSRADLTELYSMRTTLEKFAFELAWPKRTPSALEDLGTRYDALISAQEADDMALTNEREINFHSWVYELSDHSLLNTHWQRLIPLVQIYMSLHHRNHGSHGEFRHMTTDYLKIAAGSDLGKMTEHIDQHMKQGLSTVMSAV